MSMEKSMHRSHFHPSDDTAPETRKPPSSIYPIIAIGIFFIVLYVGMRLLDI